MTTTSSCDAKLDQVLSDFGLLALFVVIVVSAMIIAAMSDPPCTPEANLAARVGELERHLATSSRKRSRKIV